MRKKILAILSLTLLSYTFLTAQIDLAIGQWKSHLPFDAGRTVTQSNSKVYFATELAVLAIDKTELSLERMTKVEGLSHVGVSIIKYNRLSDVLIIVYNNGVIDLVREEEVLTLLNVSESNIILGDKRVFNIFVENDSIVYLAANFGITNLNLNTGKSPSTTKTPVDVLDVATYKGFLYAATREGVYIADLEHNLNIDDFNNWEFLSVEKGFPADYDVRSMAIFNNHLYMEVNDELYFYDGDTLQYVYGEPDFRLEYITAEGERLIAGFRCNNNDVCNFGKVLYFDESHNFEMSPSACNNFPRYAVEDEQGRVWLADNWADFRRDENGTCKKIEVNSPFSINMREMIVSDGQLWIAAGGINEAISALKRNDGFFSLIDGQWSVYNRFNVPEIGGGNPLIDFYVIRRHPENGKIYAGAFWDGLVEFDGENFKVFNDTNSTMTNAAQDDAITRVTGLAFDSENQLWVANHTGEVPLSVLKNDGTWQGFVPACNTQDDFMDMAIDAFGYKWMVLGSDANKGIIVFDEGDIDDPTDDACKVITSSNSNLPSNKVNTIEVDLDGGVWVGTQQGPIVFECDVINTDCPGSLRIGELDEFGAFLLEDQDIRTIAIDGANRKWFGTTNGIFVQSPSGERQIAVFNEDNSPLFDDNIIDIAFNHETGEVFVGTGKGLQSFRAEATEGGTKNSSNVLVFPNPVRPDYSGPIAIKGLAQDADVKITDVNGQLVFETEALGGQAIWNGKDYNGRKANSGVYLVFSTSNNTQNPDAAVAKILFMN